MRDLPIVFPVSLAVIFIMLFFTSAYAISAQASEDPPAQTSSVVGSGIQDGEQPIENVWFEDAAVFVCPFH